jgi:hypothetical protein
VSAQCADTIALGDFAKWIVKHIDVWFAFAQSLGLGLSRMEEIVFVTGRHLARSSINVVFSESQGGEQVSYGVTTDTSGVDVAWRLSREDIRGVAFNCGPSGQVRFFAFHVYDEIAFILMGFIKGFAGESVHICQRFPCHSISEDITKGSRRSESNSGSRWV